MAKTDEWVTVRETWHKCAAHAPPTCPNCNAGFVLVAIERTWREPRAPEAPAAGGEGAAE